jgi:chromosome segregation ATPase
MPIKTTFLGGETVATPEDVKAVENRLGQYYKAKDAVAIIQQINEDISRQKKGNETNKKDINELKQATGQLSETTEKYAKELASFRKKAEAGLQKISSAEFATEVKALFEGQMERFRKSGKETLQAFEQAETTKRELGELLKSTTELVDSKKNELIDQLDMSWRKILLDLDSKGEAHKKMSDEIQTGIESALIKFEEQVDSLSKIYSDAKLGIQSSAASETLSISALVNEANVRLDKKLGDASSELERMFTNAQALTEDHKQRMDASDLIAAEVFDFRKLLPEKDKVILRQQEQLVQLSAELAETQSQLRNIQAIAESCVPDSVHIIERLKWLFFGKKPVERKVVSDDGQKGNNNE